jgi:AbrB family looped-hinge helix DNA binding protein
MHMSATVTAKGQITIPKAVRDHLGIRPGSKVDFRRLEHGQIAIVKAGSTDRRSRIGRMRGTARRDWTTDELMSLLRPAD